MERILEIIDTIVVTSLLVIQKFAFNSCGLVIGTIHGITDPQVQGASSLLTFVALLALGYLAIKWWFLRLFFFTSVHSPRAPRTSLGDLFMLTLATLLVPPVLLYICFFFLCWWKW